MSVTSTQVYTDALQGLDGAGSLTAGKLLDVLPFKQDIAEDKTEAKPI